MVLAGQYVVQFLSEGSLRPLHQPPEHLKHGVAAVVITGQRTSAGNVPHGVFGDDRPHGCHVAAGERVKRLTDRLGIRVLNHHGS